eukprot:2766767-Heterocapsa_arctica.AAC.1
MKYREREDAANLNNFWQEQAYVIDFATGIRRAVVKQEDEMSWVRSIGVSRLAGNPDILSTGEITNKTYLWNASERNIINDKVAQGKPSFAIDFSIPSFIRSPAFEAYKLLPRGSEAPFSDQELGDQPFTTGDTLTA